MLCTKIKMWGIHQFMVDFYRVHKCIDAITQSKQIDDRLSPTATFREEQLCVDPVENSRSTQTA